MNKQFLHLGCGHLRKDRSTPEFRTDKWDEVRVDIDSNVDPDIEATMTDLSVIEDKSYDAIYSSHNIEHLYAHEVELALNEMSRVLKDDGFLIITCPDLKSVAAQVAEGRLVETLYESGKGPISALDILYGLRSDIRDGNYHMAHKVGFTAQVLYSSLLTFGFKRAVIAEHPATYVLWGIATKNENDIPDDLVIELKKHTNLIV
tara:strand:+ start:321 stop:932 length:612 start_codon:yes stop_codon:yes gene_type:complete